MKKYPRVTEHFNLHVKAYDIVHEEGAVPITYWRLPGNIWYVSNSIDGLKIVSATTRKMLNDVVVL